MTVVMGEGHINLIAIVMIIYIIYKAINLRKLHQPFFSKQCAYDTGIFF